MTTIQLIDLAIQAAIQAGIKIMEVYSSADFDVELKDDLTPVTRADRDAHDEILKQLVPAGLPVLSEEGLQLSHQERKGWELFWLVDPLDGTKEFIKRNGEFTVNIALIHKDQAVAGVIYAPVSGALYAGIAGTGAWKLVNLAEDCNLQLMQHSGVKLPELIKQEDYVVAVSRSHMNPETEDYLDELRKNQGSIRLVSRGSSLKICMVAEGTAAIYPKIGTTMEWDTAAGHAIVKAAGKNIFQPDLETELRYNKENLQNPHFIVV